MIGDATGTITLSLIFRLNSGFPPVPLSLAAILPRRPVLEAREGSRLAKMPIWASSRPANLPVYRSGPARRALESADVIFVEENGEGPGVRLRKRIG